MATGDVTECFKEYSKVQTELIEKRNKGIDMIYC